MTAALPFEIQIPEPLGTVHRGDDDLPWVEIMPGTEMKVTHVNLKDGLWVVRDRIAPGTKVQTHRHTGPVFAFTVSGTWYYLESPDEVNHAGSYLFEPAGSTHTLYVPEDSDGPADVWYAIWGANLNLDEDGRVETIVDAAATLAVYRAFCKQAGLAEPNVYVEQ